MKKLLEKHISRPYALIFLTVLLFGFVMTGLIPIGNGYIINSQCTENGRFIEYNGGGCGGFSLFGLDHFLWHPRVTIPVGIVLLLFEALAWALLLFSVFLLVPLLRDLEFKQNPFTGKNAHRTYIALIIGLLLTIHFSASGVNSTVLEARTECSITNTACVPCPGVMAELEPVPVKEDYGWPFHIVRQTFKDESCGMQPTLIQKSIDPLAAVFNVAIWSVLSYAVLHWLSTRTKLLDDA